jgi:hypothetical protein
MIKANGFAANLLHRNDRTSLVVVRMDPHGNPDSVSYWKNTGRLTTKRHEISYKNGVLVDMSV